MWDYDKLFAEGNIIGVSSAEGKVINLVCSKLNHNIDGIRCLYSNDDLSYANKKIQYIIRLDEHGKVAEKLFNREEDMSEPMLELKTGMFIRLLYEGLGYVDVENKRIIYQNGGYDFIEDILNNEEIIAVYGGTAYSFNSCEEENIIWKSSKYQKYLNSQIK